MSTPSKHSATRRGDFWPRGTSWWARRVSRRCRAGVGASLGCRSATVPALTFHFMQSAGTLAEHFSQLFDGSLADSSWADRRARLPWAIFAELMRRVLRPLAPRRQREAFWRGWRLIALDGTQFSLTNTPQITATTQKARTRRGRAAFAKITTTVLVELGVHNPLAAAIGRAASPSGRWPSVCWPSCRNARWCWPIGCMGAPRLRTVARRLRAGRQSLLAARPPRYQTAADPTLGRWQPAGPRRGASAPHASPGPALARGSRDSRPRRATRSSHPRAAIVDQSGRCADGARSRTRPALRPALGTRAVFPRSETSGTEDRPLAESHHRDRGPGNCRPRLDQRVARRRARPGRRRPVARPARELHENPGALCQTDVAVARLGPRRVD